jgi:ubiquinone/menaquinone biosynthesis C-methylase UbiE
VIGIDTSPEMLTVAREKVPAAELHEADLHDLPVVNDSADIVVCALSLTHVPDLGRALAEFVRVLRPNGHLVLSDSRGLIGDLSPPAVRARADGTFGYMQTWHRLTSDYLEAALPLGLQVQRCVEPRRPTPLLADDGTYHYDDEPPPAHVPGNPPDIWALHQFSIAATNAAFQGNPVAIIWHFQLSA